MTYDKRGSRTARQPRPSHPKGRGHEIIQAQADERILCTGWMACYARQFNGQARTREGCSEWSILSLPLSSKHRRTLLTGLTGWEFFSMDSGSPGYCRLGGVLSSWRGNSVRPVRPFLPPVQHSTTAFITTSQ